MKDIKARQKEIKRIIKLLNKADSKLKSASNWGFFDLVGGKTLSSLVKNQNIKKADRYLRTVQKELFQLQTQLSYLNTPINLGLNLGVFTRYMDILKDHTMADLYVQSKIKEERRNIKELKRSLKKLSRELSRI